VSEHNLEEEIVGDIREHGAGERPPRPRIHDNDVRAFLAWGLLVAVVGLAIGKVCVGMRLGFSCPVDQAFDSIIAALGAAFTTTLGFYFGERRG
jgi:hypothetical protein